MSVKRGPKYKVGDRYYMRKSYKGLAPNAEVVIVRVDKKGRHTWVDVQDVNGTITEKVPVIKLRKRAR